MSKANTSSELSSENIEKVFKAILIDNESNYVPANILEEKGIASDFDTTKPTVGEEIFKKAQYQINIKLINILYKKDDDSILITPKTPDGDVDDNLFDMMLDTLGEAWMILSLYASENSIPSSVGMKFVKDIDNYVSVKPASKFIQQKASD